MKKYMDKLRKNIRINKNLFIFLLVIVIIGLISGSLFVTILGADDKTVVIEYMKDFFNNVQTEKLNYDTSLINTLIFTVGFALIVWILGISVIGFFIVIFMLFMKAFILGFSISSIISCYGIKGLILSIIYVFPHHIINILVFIILAAYALIISFKLIQCLTGKKTLNFKNFMNRYLIILAISVVILILTSLYEIYVVPKLLYFFMNIIK